MKSCWIIYIGLLLVALSKTYAVEYHPDPDIGTGYQNAEKAKITSQWTAVVPNGTKELTATRASGDRDTRDCDVLVDDTLKNDWPRWMASAGTFPSGDKGTSVTWTAPDTIQDVTIYLYEEDTAPAVTEPDTGSRDDTGLSGYGQLQEQKDVRVASPAVELFVRTSGNTTNTSPGPDSRGKLGLWNDQKQYKFDMKLRCTNHQTGDTVNGGASYLTSNSHPWATGTKLKTEMYGHITDRGDYDDEVIETLENWAFYQEMRGWIDHNGTKGYIPSYPGGYPNYWSFDAPNYYDSSAAFFDLGNNYLYFEDPPGESEKTGGSHGDYYQWDMGFRTWIVFKVGEDDWLRVSVKKEWGMKSKIENQGGSWVVTQQAYPSIHKP